MNLYRTGINLSAGVDIPMKALASTQAVDNFHTNGFNHPVTILDTDPRGFGIDHHMPFRQLPLICHAHTAHELP